VSSGDEAAGRRQFPDRVGRDRQSFGGAAADVDRGQPREDSRCSIWRAGWRGTGAAGRLRARKGRIAAGYDADFVVFDPDGEFTVTEDRLHYRHPVSPYLGETLRGVVKATYLRGSRVC
jgi:cytosine/adenosine deaminase-related metal-dependent hydrolase